jgi:hypothetical protein
MTNSDDNLKLALANCQSTIEACVIVGGTLIARNYGELKNCVQRGLKVRFLFPDPSSEWLVTMVHSAGFSIEQYKPRIFRSLDRVQELGPGVEYRWYATPVTNWFVLMDRKLVWHKMFALTHDVAPRLEDSPETLSYYSNLFNQIWKASSKQLQEVISKRQRINDLKQLIYIHRRALQKLKEQQALFGSHTPPHILIEIEDKEAQIDQLQMELTEISG